MSPDGRHLAVFAYGSLVSATSAGETLGRPVEPEPATLAGWSRGFTVVRDNRTSEKTFARRDDGTIPDWVLGLDVAAIAEGTVNGALIAVDEAELDRLDLREIRYRRVEVGDAVAGPAAGRFDRVYAYAARPEHHAPVPPAGAVIIAAYEATVEDAFAGLGPAELDRYLATTSPCAAERIEADLVADLIPAGNPRRW
ncbi:MAG TPA: gamma-glutamylcyclotransferase family protein [Solirubrobacterales bacterium]|nr:gamma-glutamylcyclotransferase family protein [Solirubrobacterales bacterium]